MPAFAPYESTRRVTFGAVVVLEVGDWLDESGFSLAPARSIQVESYLRAAGIRTFDRGNRSHELRFVRWQEFSTVQEAEVYQLTHTKALEVGGVDVLIQMDGYTGGITLKGASIVSAPSSTWERFCKFEYTILGGELTGGLTPPGMLGLGDGSGGLGLGDGTGGLGLGDA